MNNIEDLLHSSALGRWTLAPLVFFTILLLGLMLRRFIWNRLEKWTDATETVWDDHLLEALSAPSVVLVLVAALSGTGQAAPQEFRSHPLVLFGTKVGLIVVAFWILERAASVFFKFGSLPGNFTASTRTLLSTIARTVIISIGLLIMLDTIGVSITPILASLGVGSVAIALALQDTLSNFFGGLYVLVDKPIRIGDFVKIDDSEGHVEKIGWRSTRVRLQTNDTVVIPNNKVSSAHLKNYDLPDSASIFTVDVGVSYDSDLQFVENVTLEVAREVLRTVPGGVATFAPAVRYNAFADSSINFKVVLQVQRYTDHSLVRHEFIKALHVRYNREGISIPFPHRVFVLPQAQSDEQRRGIGLG